ncbi:MAG: YidC/Oxa1 family membrane protein insertase [Firmicutes bacterium]|nr:YidC/Oxa1 family membrane protein insertase [Bacillota bacterium]
MKKIKIGILVVLLLSITGCGNSNYIMEGKNQVKYEETGQVLQKDILCKPEDKELDELYTKYKDQTKIDYEELPKCSEFKLTSNKADGIWEGIFVKPLAYIILKLGYLLNNFGLSVILIGLAIRLILMPVSRKTMKQSSNMKKAQPELARIEKKYANKTDNEAMMAKSQEMMMVYKKYNISPFGSCLLAFIQLPLFFAFLQAINRTPAIFEDTFLGLTLGTTPLVGLLEHHEWLYIIIIALTILTTYLSFRNAMSTSNSGNPEMDKQMQFMFKFMIIMISVASLYLSTALALYWVATNAFVVIQNYVLKKLDEREEKNDLIIKPKKDSVKKDKKVNKKGK